MRSRTKRFRLKISVFLIVFFITTVPVFTQSVLTLDPGTSMGVLTGTDLCVNIRNGTGILYGGGTICGGLVSVEPVAGNEIPREFSLGQNYPNPFNPVTKISFSIPQSANTKLTVFDISGKQVAELVNNTLNAGTYNVDFDAGNLGSGVYFYKIEAGKFSETRKMILVK
jgi:hypothetical protein